MLMMMVYEFDCGQSVPSWSSTVYLRSILYCCRTAGNRRKPQVYRKDRTGTVLTAVKV